MSSIFDRQGISIAQPDITTTIDGIVHVAVTIGEQEDQAPIRAAMNEISEAGPFQVNVQQIKIESTRPRVLPHFVRTQPLFDPPPVPGQMAFGSDEGSDDDGSPRTINPRSRGVVGRKDHWLDPPATAATASIRHRHS